MDPPELIKGRRRVLLRKIGLYTRIAMRVTDGDARLKLLHRKLGK